VVLPVLAFVCVAVIAAGSVATGVRWEPVLSALVALVPKGAQLLLVADDAVEHIIANGAWPASGPPQAHAEPGAPPMRNVDIKGGTAQIGPFANAGVFQLYCTLHRGMNLIVVVQ
jgi:hypothetical protein